VTASAAQLRDNPFIDRWSDEDIDAQAERHQSMPCPALQEDGSCGIYPFRPLTCRSMGIPTEEDGIVQGACEVQSFVPLIRLSRSLREEEDLLAKEEADALSAARRETQAAGEELFLPFAFLPLPHTGMAA
jgi:Fe-S-cluster containining protein